MLTEAKAALITPDNITDLPALAKSVDGIGVHKSAVWNAGGPTDLVELRKSLRRLVNKYGGGRYTARRINI